MTDHARQTPLEPLDIDLRPAREVAARWVADDIVPCAAIGVIDAAGRFRCDFVPGRDGAIDLRSVFFLASLTKGIVATAVMRYVDEAGSTCTRRWSAIYPSWLAPMQARSRPGRC